MASKNCLKLFLITVNSLLLLACAGLMYIGVWSLREYSNYGYLMPKVYMIGLPVGIIFFVGSLLFVVAIVGIVASCSESKCLIATYCTLLLVTFVLLGASIGLLYACEHIVVGGMQKDLELGLQEYFIDPNVTKEVDYLQQSRQCCGVNNYTDWIGTPWYNNQTHSNESFNYPSSCCAHENCTSEVYFELFDLTNSTFTNSSLTNSSFTSLGFVVNDVFTKGCYPALSHLLHSKFIISSSVSASVAAILVVGFAMICALYSRRTDFEYIGFVDDDAVRV